MADKETGLNIPVSAYADKDSAKSAINELTKGVLSSQPCLTSSAYKS